MAVVVRSTSIAAATACLLLAACGGPSRGEIEDAIERGWAETPTVMRGAPEGPIGWEGGLANAAGLAADTTEKLGGGFAAEAARAVVGGAVGLAADAGLQPAQGLDEELSIKFAKNWEVSSLTVLDQRTGDAGSAVAAVRYDLHADRRSGTSPVVTQGRQTLHLERDGGRWTVKSATLLDEAR